MGRPAKPYAVLESEKKSHRTKAELQVRKNAEAALLTGEPMKERPEVKENAIAHREFLRQSKILRKIGKFDAVYENPVNRYCLICAECHEKKKMLEGILQDLRDLEQERSQLDAKTYYSIKEKLLKKYDLQDKKLQDRRKMMLELEKENGMTIASSLRIIPKKEEGAVSPLLEVLKGGQG